MRKLFTILFVSVCICLSAQENPNELAKPIVEEGKQLYRSEMASWYGTDLFLEKFSDRSKIGGYFSYVDNDTPKCVFFSRGEDTKVIGTITFDNTYNTKTAKADLSERTFTQIEKEYFTIRQLSLSEINSDTLFETYNNTSLNLIPLISGDLRKVYVLTGPQKNGVVIFGNDYLLTFDKDNKLLTKKRLHKNIIPINYDGTEVEATIHSHLPETGDFITATDICTLLLYEKFTNWKQHNVVSKRYLNIWNCKTNQLAVIPMETIKKINQDQENRKKKKDDN